MLVRLQFNRPLLERLLPKRRLLERPLPKRPLLHRPLLDRRPSASGRVTELPEPLRGLALDHVAIAVPDLEAASAPYRLLGLTAGDDELVAGQGVRVRMFGADAGKVELLEPTAPDTPVGRFLAKRGSGLHHLALRVDRLESAVSRLAEAGADFIDPVPRQGHSGSRVIFLHPGWTGGVLLELVEHASGHGVPGGA
ncbi:MAG: methylmalonyl-CoA epimerase [Trueperaceae bacterium]